MKNTYKLGFPKIWRE